jgi:hypothetical protein
MRKSPDEVNLQPEDPRGVDTILGEHHPCTASRIAQYEERVVTSEDHILQELLSMYLVGPHADNRKGGREANHAGPCRHGRLLPWHRGTGDGCIFGGDRPPKGRPKSTFLSSPRDNNLGLGPAFSRADRFWSSVTLIG